METLRLRLGNLPVGLGLLAGALAMALAGCASRTLEPVEPVEIQVDRPGAVARLSQAIRIKTISAAMKKGESGPCSVDPEVNLEADFGKLQTFLQENFPEAHRVLKREVVNQYSLLFTWPGQNSGLKPILLAAHLDVVPVDVISGGAWAARAFSGEVDEQGMIWGRGALDDKLSVLGLLEAVEFLLDQGFTPNRTIYFAFGHDEELEGTCGARTIATELKRRKQSLEFVLDEGSIIGIGLVPGVEKPVAMIGVAEKGYLSIKLTAEAVGGHSSIPPTETAIGRLARALDRLQTNRLPAELRPPVSDMLTAVAPEMSLLEKVAMQNQWLFGGFITSTLTDGKTSNAMVRTTTAPTIISGGVKDNVLPQSASAVINFRILPGDTIASVTRHVEETIADPKVKVERIQESANEPVLPGSIDSDSYRTVERTVREIFPEAVVAPALVIAATDSRHYRELTSNIFRFLPVTLDEERLSGIHGRDERLETKCYERLIAFYIQLMRNSAGPS